MKKSSSRSSHIEGDLRAALDAAFTCRTRQPGEITAADEAARYQVTEEFAREQLNRLVKQGRLSKRCAGKYVFYREVKK